MIKKDFIGTLLFFVFIILIISSFSYSQITNLKPHSFKPNDIKQIRVYTHAQTNAEVVKMEIYFHNLFDGKQGLIFIFNCGKNRGMILQGYNHLCEIAQMIKKGQIKGLLYHPTQSLTSFNSLYFNQKKVNIKLYIIYGFYFCERGGSPQMKTGITAKVIQSQFANQNVDISGLWHSSIGLVYEINQNGNQFNWIVHNKNQPGSGNINGKELFVKWKEGNMTNSTRGIVKEMNPEGLATIIEWDNGVTFFRK